MTYVSLAFVRINTSVMLFGDVTKTRWF